MSVDASASAAAVVGALTSELLRSLRDECEGEAVDLNAMAQHCAHTVFRGVFGRLAALSDSLEAVHTGGKSQESEWAGSNEAEHARWTILALVEAVRSAMTAEALTLLWIPGTTYADGDQESEEEAGRYALRAMVLAPFRAAFARELHDRVTSTARHWGLEPRLSTAERAAQEPERELDEGDWHQDDEVKEEKKEKARHRRLRTCLIGRRSGKLTVARKRVTITLCWTGLC